MNSFTLREKGMAALSVALLVVIGLLLSRKPDEVIHIRTVESVRVEYKEKATEQASRSEIRKPDGTVIIKETSKKERGLSVDSLKKSEAVVEVEKTSLPRYSLGYTVPLSVPFPQEAPLLGTIEVGVRLGDLPVFGVGSYNIKHSEFGLGIRVEF